jgi:hypothetical protein
MPHVKIGGNLSQLIKLWPQFWSALDKVSHRDIGTQLTCQFASCECVQEVVKLRSRTLHNDASLRIEARVSQSLSDRAPAQRPTTNLREIADQSAGKSFAAGGRSLHSASSATNRTPVTSVLVASPNMFLPATKSPTTVPAALTVTTVTQ